MFVVLHTSRTEVYKIKVPSLCFQLHLPHKNSWHCRETENIAQHTDLQRHWTYILECKNTCKWKGLLALGQWREGKEKPKEENCWALLIWFCSLPYKNVTLQRCGHSPEVLPTFSSLLVVLHRKYFQHLWYSKSILYLRSLAETLIM